MISILLTFQNSILFGQSKEIAREQVPEAVLNAIETDFPYWRNIKWYTFDPDINEWASVSTNEDLPKILDDYYVVTAKGENITTHAVYDRNGKLLRSKTELKNATLPTEILKTIATDYPGWKMSGNIVVIRNFDENRKNYRVTLENAGKNQTVYFDRMGKKIA